MPAWSIEKIIRIVEIALNVILYACKSFGVDFRDSDKE